MSSFIVEDKTIHRILNWVQSNQYDNHNSMFVPFELKNTNHADMTNLGKKLIALNYKATNSRYNEKLEPVSYKFDWLTNISDVQSLKSAECLRYQCSEGNVPKTKLFKLLNQLIHGMQNKIIHTITAYEQAEWG